MALLASRRYRILAADDGYLILQRTARPLARAPVLPPRFFTFMFGSGGRPLHPLARMGSYLELENVQVERREQVNLRVPDVIVTTTWRVLRPLPAGLQMRTATTGPAARRTWPPIAVAAVNVARVVGAAKVLSAEDSIATVIDGEPVPATDSTCRVAYSCCSAATAPSC